MCGIVGSVALDGGPADLETVRRMRDAVWHRGPDDAGVWSEGPVALGHRRLSILDLSPLGRQPMQAEDRTAFVTYNGEVFNFVELRLALERSGERFASDSDTEVLLRLWQREGPAMVHRLVGMFAFAIWDRATATLFAARDRLGIKPFYYHQSASRFLFASEAKALLAHPAVRASLDWQGLADLQFAGYPLAERTLLAGIRQLQPGHELRVANGAVSVRRYWQLQYAYDRHRSRGDTVGELGGLLDDAVRMHCRSDAPVGAHLSGGLDSSTVAALAARHRPGLSTFSIRFTAGAAYDESRYARAVAERIGSRHHEESPEDIPLPDLFAFLTYQVEAPVTRTAIAYFGAARLARRHVTVALTGHGGDEVFGGYPAQFEVGLGVRGDFASGSTTRPGRRDAMDRLAFLWKTEGATGVLQRVTRRLNRPGAAAPEAVDRWVAAHCASPEPGRHPAFTRAALGQFAGYSPLEAYREAFVQAPTDELFDRCLHHDLMTYLPSLLAVEDRTSMAVSLESRVPLLDHRLVEFAATVPPHVKVADHRPKSLLREAMRAHLPEAVVTRRDKGAFPVPVDEWLRGPQGDWARDLLRESRTLERGIYRPEWIAASVDQRRGLLPLLATELWCRMFLDADAALLAAARTCGERVRTSMARLPER
jgi:asparagine synthase (glutamine-hydrolysing)